LTHKNREFEFYSIDCIICRCPFEWSNEVRFLVLLTNKNYDTHQ